LESPIPLQGTMRATRCTWSPKTWDWRILLARERLQKWWI